MKFSCKIVILNYKVILKLMRLINIRGVRKVSSIFAYLKDLINIYMKAFGGTFLEIDGY